jgi:acyl-CoA thioester hydrolase
MAGLLSAKEAVYKAIPDMPESAWTDIEVVHDRRGKPSFVFHGPVGALFSDKLWGARLSITHSGEYASSVVVITREENAPSLPARRRSLDPVQFKEIDTRMRVRPADLDSLGHVNNAAVLELFEAGRWAWMDAHGVRRNAQVLPVVTRTEVDYHKEIGMEDVVVRTTLHEPPIDLDDGDTYRVTFLQRVLVGGDAIAAEGHVSVGFVDAASRTLRTLNEFLEASREKTS